MYIFYQVIALVKSVLISQCSHFAGQNGSKRQ